jgi:hypothetical protein
MKNNFRLNYIIVAIIFQFECLGVAYERKLNEDYYLSALDADADRSIIRVESSGYSFTVVYKLTCSIHLKS